MNSQCLTATNMPENKTVLWIDPHLEYRSPSTKHLLYALPRIRVAGWKVEVWCLRSDASPDEVSHTVLPVPNSLGPFEPFPPPQPTSVPDRQPSGGIVAGRVRSDRMRGVDRGRG
jgi:hypothetical protein